MVYIHKYKWRMMAAKKKKNVELQQYNIISNFTQLVTAPSYDDDILYDQDLF